MMGKARIPLQIDIGFGDILTPGRNELELPTLLDTPSPILYVYPPETVIAEKFEAMVQIGITNSRLKDYYDIYFLSRTFDFSGQILADAIKATLARRRTSLPDNTLPLALTYAYAEMPGRRTQWAAFTKRIGARAAIIPSLDDVIRDLAAFLTPVIDSIRLTDRLERSWNHTLQIWE